jgi:predicted nucleic acid-binding protein
LTLYLDTSSLVKLYIEERGSDEIARLLADADVVATSALAYPEARATIARRRRERLLTAAQAVTATAQLDADWPRFVVIPLDEPSARSAGRLADTHGIRGGGATHLAAFESLLSHAEDADVRFSCADERLAKAARGLG